MDINSHIRYLGNDTFEDIALLDAYPLPDFCPVCKKSINPEFILIYFKFNGHQELLCSCPDNKCKSLFFAVYKECPSETSEYSLDHFTPLSREEKLFPDEIYPLSPDFIEIYNQAYVAEQEKLNLICGVGYRKALEYLIKDFALKQSPEDIEKIKRMPLQQCLKKFITDPKIKAMAERAIWLGNDETHYVRKWKSKDLKDLKNLIELTVYFISITFKVSKYSEEMFVD
ncbi:hypothetical protein ACAN81_20455 [Bacillus velezensis]|uniref:hypothetical protein n=1 Tax=Bacillus velezensis TaxID=492670 RepID=UPI003F70FAEA